MERRAGGDGHRAGQAGGNDGKHAVFIVHVRLELPRRPQPIQQRVQDAPQAAHHVGHDGLVHRLPAAAQCLRHHLIHRDAFPHQRFQIGQRRVLGGGEGGAGRQHALQHIHLAVKAVGGQLPQNFLLGGKILIHRALADAGGLGDLPHRQRGQVLPLFAQGQHRLIDGFFPAPPLLFIEHGRPPCCGAARWGNPGTHPPPPGRRPPFSASGQGWRRIRRHHRAGHPCPHHQYPRWWVLS